MALTSQQLKSSVDTSIQPSNLKNPLPIYKNSNYFFKNTIEEINLKNWGVFDSANVSLSSKPSFIAITGETGSGKSVFISALEYISGESRIKFQRKNDNNNIYESVVSLFLNSDLFSRSYNYKTKKSNCEKNNEKISVKNMSSIISNTVRFWSTDSIDRINGESFIYYVDMNSNNNINNINNHQFLLDEIELSYNEWMESKNKLLQLQNLENKKNNVNEMQLISFFMSEIITLEKKLIQFFNDLKILLEDYNAIYDKNNNNMKEFIENPKNSFTIPVTPVEELLQLLNECLSTIQTNTNTPIITNKKLFSNLDNNNSKRSTQLLLDYQLMWNILTNAEILLKKISKTISNPIFSITLNEQKINNNINTKNKISSQRLSTTTIIPSLESSRDLNDAQIIIENYSDKLLLLQKELKSIGLLSIPMAENIETAYETIQESLNKLILVKQNIRIINSEFPDISNIYNQLIILKSEWDNLSRKHLKTTPNLLQELRNNWHADLLAMDNLANDLPLQYKIVDESQNQELNQILKSLSSSDPRLHYNGWDSCFLTLNTPSFLLLKNNNINNNDFDSNNHDNSNNNDDIPLNSNVIFNQLLSLSENNNNNNNNEDMETSKSSEIMSNVLTLNNPISNMLSSGECARLALALETVSFSQKQENNDEKCSDGLLILDEIDAHIGGEAAVAVARLLKQQGKIRQILAVTHNPIIAAAADKHIIVERIKDNNKQNNLILSSSLSSSSNTQNDNLNRNYEPKSVIYELKTRIERERELVRMTTGNLDTTAGYDLAKALLDMDF
eukprot:gene14066-18869_t